MSADLPLGLFFADPACVGASGADFRRRCGQRYRSDLASVLSLQHAARAARGRHRESEVAPCVRVRLTKCFRHRAHIVTNGRDRNSTPLLVSITAISLLLAVGIATSAMAAAWGMPNPQGDSMTRGLSGTCVRSFLRPEARWRSVRGPRSSAQLRTPSTRCCSPHSSPVRGRSANPSPRPFRRRHPMRSFWR